MSRLLWSLLLVVLCQAATARDIDLLRVHLSWIDQAQFAGFYVAESRGYFAAEGIKVTTTTSDLDKDPIMPLMTGTADVAILPFATAQTHAGDKDPVVNIAQVFDGPSLMLICRKRDGISNLDDVVGKTIWMGSVVDKDIVVRMLERALPGQSGTRFMVRGNQGEHLLDGSASCITGMSYNEYPRLLKAGFSVTDLSIFLPKDFGVRDIEDGLYVLKSRLSDPDFIDRLAHLIRGLRRGWEEVRRYPSSAVDVTLRKNPALDRTEQMEMLEAVLSLLPATDLLQLRLDESVTPVSSEPVWTHVVWDRVLLLDGKPQTFTPSTLFRVAQTEKNRTFDAILLFGFCVFALSATLEATSQGYDLWGRLIIALVSVMGGGVIRDLILARGRLPFSFLHDPTVPVAITGVVVAFSVLLVFYPDSGRTKVWLVIRRYSEAIGFAIISVYGAMACILSGSDWYWAPASAAVTVAGGGILRDIIVNREPRNFRGAIYEEVAVLSGLLVVAGFVLSNHFEHNASIVQAVLIFIAVMIAVLRLLIDKYQIKYPRWLAQPQRH
jgi:NitT/TauT family transport system substrate-binding protein